MKTLYRNILSLTSGGCVDVQKLDASGVPRSDPFATPAIICLSGFVGDFSVWAVVIATPMDLTAPVISDVPGNIVAEATGPDGEILYAHGKTSMVICVCLSADILTMTCCNESRDIVSTAASADKAPLERKWAKDVP